MDSDAFDVKLGHSVHSYDDAHILNQLFLRSKNNVGINVGGQPERKSVIIRQESLRKVNLFFYINRTSYLSNQDY